MSNRGTQFQGFAKLLFGEIESMFNNLYIQEDNGEEHAASETRKDIHAQIAERAYDFACNIVDDDPQHISHVSDMTEWPQEQDEEEIARQKEIAEILSHGSELDAMELYEKLCNAGLPEEQE